MRKPKLIILNGFAGSGKSTIAKKYIDDCPLALAIEGDELIVNLGQWLQYEDEARKYVYEMIISLASNHLSSGNDVVIPYLVTDSAHITHFREVADHANASFYNFLLFNEKKVAISRLLSRGTWGEAGTDPLSEKDAPEIERLYNEMEIQLEGQEGVIVINQQDLAIEDTYKAVLMSLT